MSIKEIVETYRSFFVGSKHHPGKIPWMPVEDELIQNWLGHLIRIGSANIFPSLIPPQSIPIPLHRGADIKRLQEVFKCFLFPPEKITWNDQYWAARQVYDGFSDGGNQVGKEMTVQVLEFLLRYATVKIKAQEQDQSEGIRELLGVGS